MSLDEWLGYGIPEEVLEQASYWITRLEASDLSESERKQFNTWLDNDPLHRWAFEDMSQLWARMSISGNPVGYPSEENEDPFKPETPTGPTNPVAGPTDANLYLIAANLLILLGFIIGFQ